jgi:hypothetical protein
MAFQLARMVFRLARRTRSVILMVPVCLSPVSILTVSPPRVHVADKASAAGWPSGTYHQSASARLEAWSLRTGGRTW